MNNHAICKRLLPLLALATGLVLVGCGDEYSPSAAASGPLAPASSGVPTVDEDQVTAVQFSVSPSYDADSNEVQLFVRPVDQDSNLIQNVVEANFATVLNPKVAPRGIDPSEMSLTQALAFEKIIALVIDSSGSMVATTEAGEARIQVAKDAARLFVAGMAAGDQTAVIDFDSSAKTVQQLTHDAADLDAAITKLDAEGATNLGGALSEAVAAIGTRPGKRAAILLTDGDDTVDSVIGGPDDWLADSSSARNQGLKAAQNAGLVVYTVGLGTDLSEIGLADLKTIAAETGGKYFEAPTASALLTAFQSTIPLEVDALPPLDTYRLSFENPSLPPRGSEVTVPLRAGFTYKNRNGTFQRSFEGSYLVK